MYKVDIIIPVYKSEKSLECCLDSLKAQTFPYWRAICIDNGSPDLSGDILDSYSSEDERFMVIHQQECAGLSQARNTGMDFADAEYVMFMQQDGKLHPQALELAVSLAEKEGSDIVYWDACGKLPKTTFSQDKIKYTSYRCSDKVQPDFAPAIRNCHDCRHLFRRRTIQDTRFIKGLNHKNILWWSELMLLDLGATAINLPLYQRNGTVHKNIIADSLRSLGYSFRIYRKEAVKSQMDNWSREIKWPELARVASGLSSVKKAEDKASLKSMLGELWNEGCLDDYEGFSEFRTFVQLSRFGGFRPGRVSFRTRFLMMLA